MKRFYFLLAIVIAVIMSSCSNEDYKSYVPADSKMVGKIDLKEFFVQTGVDQEKFFKDIVEQYGDDVADFKNSGLDLTSPLYIFARNSGSEIVYGIVAKVADRAMAENYYAKSSKKTLKKAADYSYDVDAAASVAINDEAMLVVGKSNRDKDSSADMSIIPDEALSGAGSMAGMSSKDFEEMRSIVLNLEGNASGGVCDFVCSAKSDNKDVQERIDKTNKAFGMISEKAFSSFSSGDLCGFAMNTDGARLAELIKDAIDRSSNDQMKQMMGGFMEQLSTLLGKIRGNVVGVLNSPQDFIIKAEGKNITPDIVGMINEGGMAGALGLASTSNGYSIGGQAWFGYEDGNFYITGNENTAAQPSKVMGGPAPSALTSLMKGRKSVIYGNVARLKDMAAMSGENSRDLKAFDAIFDKVQYVTLSYK